MKLSRSKISIGIGVIVFIIVFALFCLSIYSNHRQEQKCYKEAFDLWSSVNEDYPYYMSSQESYDKNNRQSCASFYYLACIHLDKVNCAKTEQERRDGG